MQSDLSLKIRLIAPDGYTWDTMADEVVLPSLTGQIGHAPLVEYEIYAGKTVQSCQTEFNLKNINKSKVSPS